MQIIGITGTLGAGKGTVVEYLVKNKGFKHYSVRDLLIEEIKKRNLPINRDSMAKVANDLRAKFGPTYITKVLFEKAQKDNQNSIIESIRNPSELEFIKSSGGIMLAVTADQKVRYERIKQRLSEKDNVTFEEFKIQEDREMNNTDPNSQNLSKCIAHSDFLINNDKNLENLYDQIEKILTKIN